MALNAGNAACTSGLSQRMYNNWTGDTANNGLSGSLSAAQIAALKSQCYQFALAIVAEIQADATLTIPSTTAGDGMQNGTNHPSVPFVITGAITQPMFTPYYAATRMLDPAKGDYVIAGTTWAQGSPMTEIIVRGLRTPKGRYLPDPTWGVDLSSVNKLLPTAAASLRAAILQFLGYYVKQNLISRQRCTTAQSSVGLAYEVDFYDVRAETYASRILGKPIAGSF